MGHENEILAVSRDLQVFLFGITFPVACVACILVLVQRIRRRRQGRFVLPEKQMDPQPPLPDRSGGKAPVGQGVPYPKGSSHDVTRMPSACDILQPLSQLAPLPSSGYLAAMIGRERSGKDKQSYPEDQSSQSSAAYMASFSASSSDSRPTTSHTNDSYRSGSFSEGSDASRRGSEDPQHIALSPTGWRTEETPEEFVGLSDLDRAQSVQKRSQVVQQLYDVDEEGVRTWRRLMVEYR
ncbi:hypothetical protein P170DRAFT_513896 [Aspergillus steynii IBT 23096]|uniref:Uncharacterized protein n=1 Tax=Aspergillus steynii IBT 23096 TaxID=1392250 RepID=A0A2I2FSD7_9EURO|nr:uncharacterized protein P170DRAFT_513896 [Aspergillus steynii IBT 23096]PLB43544.1 hypothetical protein P170DRAFT_513896 [Aspergillus steynii IBT 23096]